MNDRIHPEKEVLQGCAFGGQEIDDFHTRDRFAVPVLLADVDQAEIVALAQGREQLSRDVAGGTGQEDALRCSG